jgi:hypothetical protein
MTKYTKDNLYDFFMKAIAICLFIQAITLLPKILSVLFTLVAQGQTIFLVLLGKGSLGSTIMVIKMGFDNYLSDLLTFVAYILIGGNLLNGGSLINKALKDA